MSGSGGPLAGLRVLDIATGLAGPFCARLLADLGASVVKVEPPDGDPARALGPFPGGIPDPQASGSFLFVNASKRRIVLDLDDSRDKDAFLGLVPGYDAVIAAATGPSLAARGIGYEAIRARNAAAILTTVVPFGSSGCWSGYEATHLITCAMGGWAASCGLPGREPLQAGGNVTDLLAGAYGAIATLLALEQRARDGAGQHVDVSAMEAAIIAAMPTGSWEYHRQLRERHSNRVSGPSWILACADGYIGVNVLTQEQWEALCHFAGRPDLAARPEYALSPARLLHAEAIAAELQPFFLTRKKDELFHEAHAWRIPFGLVPELPEIFDFEQHRARGFFAALPHPREPEKQIPVAGVPFRMSPPPPGPRPSATLNGPPASLESVREPALPAATAGPVRRLPLEGVRIIDLSMFMSAPMVTQIAGDFGADVIKVESVQRLDGWRGAYGLSDAGAEAPWELAPGFNWLNRNKREITLNLADPRGAALLKRLVATADVLVENYTPRVMPNFGLSYEALREVKSNLIMLSMPGFGLDGPWRDYTAFAWSTEQMSGLPSITGYEGGQPLFTGTTGGDPLAGVMGTVALLAALRHRRATGEGQHIDLSQVEAATLFVGDQLMEAAYNGSEPGRHGNRHPVMAPHGIYPAQDGRWLAIACRDDADWRALASAICRPELAAAGHPFATAAGRRAAAGELDALLSAWTRTRDVHASTALLQSHGVPAGPVLDGRDLLEDPHLAGRGFFLSQDRPGLGPRRYPVQPFRLMDTPPLPLRPAPLLGQHTREVLREFLAVDDAALDELDAADITGTVPIAARRP